MRIGLQYISDIQLENCIIKYSVEVATTTSIFLPKTKYGKYVLYSKENLSYKYVLVFLINKDCLAIWNHTRYLIIKPK